MTQCHRSPVPCSDLPLPSSLAFLSFTYLEDFLHFESSGIRGGEPGGEGCEWGGEGESMSGEGRADTSLIFPRILISLPFSFTFKFNYTDCFVVFLQHWEAYQVPLYHRAPVPKKRSFFGGGSGGIGD